MQTKVVVSKEVVGASAASSRHDRPAETGKSKTLDF